MTGGPLATVSGAIVLLAVAYFVIVHSASLLSVLAVYARLHRRRHRVEALDLGAVVASPAAPGISVLVTVHDDEEAALVERVRALLLLDYPRFEVVLVAAAPARRAIAATLGAFDLVRVPDGQPASLPGTVASVYRSLAHPHLVVLDVAGADRAAAIGAAMAVARHPLVCLTDTGSIVEAHALTRAVLPFLRRPDTIAAIGSVRVANGGTVDEGRAVRLRLPASPLAVLQIVDRLRAGVPGQVNLSAMNGLLAIPSAFGLFEREALVAAGGAGRQDAGGVDLALRLHRAARRGRRPYRLVFVPEPVCWIVVPERWRPLAAAERRRHRDIVRALGRHRSMILNPRYGTLGLLILPAVLAFEAFGPLLEFAGYAAAVAGLATGALEPAFAELLFLAAIVYGTLVSVAAVLIEELSSGQDAAARDLRRVVLYGILENLGYRQAAAWWRLRGAVAAMGRRTAGSR